MYGYWIVVNYFGAYGSCSCNGVLFNDESMVRGEIFATRKIARALASIKPNDARRKLMVASRLHTPGLAGRQRVPRRSGRGVAGLSAWYRMIASFRHNSICQRLALAERR